jgi:arsenate reductase
MKKNVVIYHNVRCAKSRTVCSIIAEKGIEAEIIEYLKTPLSANEIKQLLTLLGMKAEDIVRKGEPLYKNKYKGKKFTEIQWMKLLSDNPILIERPIIVKGNRAIIGRPPEKVVELLG